MGKSHRIRNSGVTLQFIEEGVGQITGSLAVATDWKVSPVAELSSTELTGETEDALDQTHRGYDFSGTFHEVDAQIEAMYERRIAAIVAGLPLPAIQIIVTRRYIDGTTPPLVKQLHGDLVLKIDSTDGSGKDFVKNTISGKAKFFTRQ